MSSDYSARYAAFVAGLRDVETLERDRVANEANDLLKRGVENLRVVNGVYQPGTSAGYGAGGEAVSVTVSVTVSGTVSGTESTFPEGFRRGGRNRGTGGRMKNPPRTTGTGFEGTGSTGTSTQV